MELVIVESPAKAKTLGGYLGKEYHVVASVGHVRALPSKPGSVDTENGFKQIFENTPNAKKYFSKIVDAAKTSDKIFLATDLDREGEAIAWHIKELLQERLKKKKLNIKRITFSEITKKVILNAIDNARDIDMSLVHSQQSRQMLDYLVGFNLSPLLWRKLPGCRSAGRVQSVALRLISDREDEILSFETKEYWDISAVFKAADLKQNIEAKLVIIEGKKLDKFDIATEEVAKEYANRLEKKEYFISAVTKKTQKRRPYAPFITSTLQQDATRKLGLSSKYVMQLAQKLYEGVNINGKDVALITYMRTDSIHISPDAIKDIRSYIGSNYNKEYLPEKARVYKTKSKNAQEAHEAIRPINIAITQKDLEGKLEPELCKLYGLIWRRAVASQMADMQLDITSLDIKATDEESYFRASGTVVKFDGYTTLYKDSAEEDEKSSRLPLCEKGKELELKTIEPLQHFTQPPPRYNEASLVKRLEELGIGRPSTYANIISVLQERKYVRLEKKRFFPEGTGRILTKFLIEFFPKYVEYNFTADLEDSLDNVASGKLVWEKLMSSFWEGFDKNIKDVYEYKIQDIIKVIEEKLIGDNKETCPDCKEGTLEFKLGKYGAFFSCSNYPDCKFTKRMFADEKEQVNIAKNTYLGSGDNGEEIYLKSGPYGWYVESKLDDKIHRCAIPTKEYEIENVDIDIAKFLLSMPKIIGSYKDNDIIMQASKYGVYLVCDSLKIKVVEGYMSMNYDMAVSIISEKEKKSKTKKASSTAKKAPVSKKVTKAPAKKKKKE